MSEEVHQVKTEVISLTEEQLSEYTESMIAVLLSGSVNEVIATDVHDKEKRQIRLRIPNKTELIVSDATLNQLREKLKLVASSDQGDQETSRYLMNTDTSREKVDANKKAWYRTHPIAKIILEYVETWRREKSNAPVVNKHATLRQVVEIVDKSMLSTLKELDAEPVEAGPSQLLASDHGFG